MKTNIIFIGLNNDLSKYLAEKVAQNYEMYFADIEKLLEYNLVDEGEIEKLCGLEYLNKLKDKTIKDIANYENTLISIPYGLFFKNNNAEFLKKYSTVVYLRFSKDVLNKAVEGMIDEDLKRQEGLLLSCFAEHDTICKENSSLTIDLPKADFDSCYKKIKKVLDEYFL